MPWQGGSPFPGYALKNLGANIRRVRGRIEELQSKRAAPEAPPVEGEGYTILEDSQDNRVRIFFEEKPSEAVRSVLKQNGFRWARSVGAWQRQLNAAGRIAVVRVRRALDPELLDTSRDG